MGANWLQFNQNLSDFSSALANQQREKVKRKQGVEDLISQLLIKSQIESAMKKQGFQEMIDAYKNAGFLGGGMPSAQPDGNIMPHPNAIDTTGTNEQGNIVGVDRNNYQLIPTMNPESPFKMELSQGAQLRQKVAETQATELAKGISPDKAGLYNLAKESIKNIQDVRKTLFPTGKAESYKRWTAYGSNPILNQWPGIPSNFSFRQNPQDVYRKMSAALSGRQLIQTGVAARPEETAKLVSQFAPSVMSQSQAALNGLNELENFYKNYINTLETKGIKTNMQSQNNDPLKLR